MLMIMVKTTTTTTTKQSALMFTVQPESSPKSKVVEVAAAAESFN